MELALLLLYRQRSLWTIRLRNRKNTTLHYLGRERRTLYLSCGCRHLQLCGKRGPGPGTSAIDAYNVLCVLSVLSSLTRRGSPKM